jgi:hypothetical protein
MKENKMKKRSETKKIYKDTLFRIKIKTITVYRIVTAFPTYPYCPGIRVGKPWRRADKGRAAEKVKKYFIILKYISSILFQYFYIIKHY